MVWKHWLALALAVILIVGCEEPTRQQTADEKDRQQQEHLVKEAQAQTGLPNIKNFREKKLAKEILELRDQTGLVTYTYSFSEMTGKYTYISESVGYALPYATQYTNPQKIEYYYSGDGHHGCYALPQCDPNGLFSPSSTEGTWVMLKDPNSSDVKPFYSETRLTVSPFKLPAQIVFDPTGRHSLPAPEKITAK